MAENNKHLYSFVVPIYNEEDGLSRFHNALSEVLKNDLKDDYEVIYCDDGSTDKSTSLVAEFCADNHKVKLLSLSRNFGKESALAAGIAAARGDAVIMLDGDGQHPVELIPKFISAWLKGSEVVIGVRVGNYNQGYIKKSGSRWFYRLFNKLTNQKLIPGSTDFRLIDKAVKNEFLKLEENDRITRGLIDWLGFKREYISFEAGSRSSGAPGYSYKKLATLAANSFVSLTLTPLYIFGYLGVFITSSSFLLGLAVLVEQLLLNDPLNWHFTGTAMLGILTLFLVGIILLSQGILSLYISHIHTQSKRRPLYIIDHKKSVGINEKILSA